MYYCACNVPGITLTLLLNSYVPLERVIVIRIECSYSYKYYAAIVIGIVGIIKRLVTFPLVWLLMLMWLLRSRSEAWTLVPRESPYRYFMICRSCWDLFRVLSYQFWSTVRQCGAKLLIHTLKLLDTVVKSGRFLTGNVLAILSSAVGAF